MPIASAPAGPPDVYKGQALGRGHGGVLGGAGDRIIAGVLGALVDQDKANIGLIPAGGGDAGVEVHIVIHGDIVVSLRGGGDPLLAQPGVDPAVDQFAVIVVLGHQQIGGIDQMCIRDRLCPLR